MIPYPTEGLIPLVDISACVFDIRMNCDVSYLLIFWATVEFLLSNSLDFDVVLFFSAVSSPRNPEGLTSLWVGNVLPEVPQDELVRTFSK